MDEEKDEALSQKKMFSSKTITILESLRLLDDYLMTKVFDKNYAATELLLKIILEKDDLKVKDVTVQKVAKSPVPKGRSITLDIFAEDSEGKNYDIEIQRSKAGADIKRARYHSAVLDSRMLQAKEDFSLIDESYVIFITEKDVFGQGEAIYSFSRHNDRTNEFFNDGNHILYVNGEYKDDESAIGKLMHDFRCTRPSDMFYPELKEPTHYFKETEGGRAIVCETIESYGNDMRNEGRAEGEQKKAKEMAVELYKNGVSVPVIATAASVSVDIINKWLGIQPA